MQSPTPVAETTRPRGAVPRLALIATLPTLVFVAHASLFGRWIEDDAGISFAYARNLAGGYGLVSQPGAAPVEGYSNFLWVLLMSVFWRLGLFHLVWMPKIAAGILTGASFLVVTTVLSRAASWGPAVAASALTLVALQPAFAIWSVSGLENPLYVFLLCLLMAGAVKLATVPEPTRWAPAVMGVTIVGVVATRPEGAVYLPVVPAVLAVRAGAARSSRRPWLAALGWYCVVAGALLGALAAFRWWYFHDVFPNTYYVRMKPVPAGSLLWLLPDTLAKARGLSQAIAGDRGATWLLLVVLVGTVALVSIGRFKPILAVLLLFAASSGLAYMLLPIDWMREYRFATPFFLFAYVYIAALAWALCALASRAPAARRLMFAGVVGLFLAGGLIHVARRSVPFARSPTVPIEIVADYYGHRYNRVAAALGLESASLLAPDLGGTLLYSRLTVVDLGGLCDRTIARTIGRDPRALHEYVFARVRPTFIHVHSSYWAKLAALDEDERFRRDYVPIRTIPRFDVGDFVRRDALRGPVEPLAAILDGGSLPERAVQGIGATLGQPG